jgi:signal transduction histidine kinase/ligand-binding sensor domain-containing protein
MVCIRLAVATKTSSRTDQPAASRRWSCVRALALFFLAASHSLFGLDPDRTLAEFYHTGWTVAEGAPTDVENFTQTKDGYLWFGSANGLFRFDGVRFQRFEPAQGGALPSIDVSGVYAAPDGGLWVGFRTGGASFIKNGRVFNYGEKEGLPSASVNSFGWDREGIVWALTGRGLFRFENSRWNKVGQEWGFTVESGGDQQLFSDNQGKLWGTEGPFLFSLPPGARRFEQRKSGGGMLREAPDGTLWRIDENDGIRAVNGELAQFYDRSKPEVKLKNVSDLWVDRDESMWVLVWGEGIARVVNQEKLGGITIGPASKLIQRYSHKDGLTDDRVRNIMEDREGNIWIFTNGGVDRFRRKSVVQGSRIMQTGSAPALIADGEGTVWTGTGRSLTPVALIPKDNQRASPRKDIQMPARYHKIACLWRDSEGAFWIGGDGVLSRWRGNRLEDIPFPAEIPEGFWDVQALTRDRTGDLWISIQQNGVFRRHAGVWTRSDKLPKLTAVVLWTDAGGRVWLGYMGNEIALLDPGGPDGDKVRIFSSSDGLQVGNVLAIGGRGGHIWAAGEFGLALFDGNRFRTIASESDRDFRGVSGVVETSNDDFWLNQANGVAHIPAAEIAAKLRDAQHHLQYELFDYRDGVPSAATSIRPLPSALEARDGRIWMSGISGTYWVDPARIHKNTLPPPVAVETIYADDKRYDPSETSRLPVLPSNVRIEYSALSLSIPERVRFRYQLEGFDKNWLDAGTRRTAYYTKLPPGSYRFHVIACNNDGVWNEAGAVAAFVVPPAFFQTVWFQMLCLCIALSILWMIYLLRLRQVSAQMQSRLNERLAERSRIARELHDTLLQSFHGLMFRFQAARNMLPRRTEEALQILDEALEQTEQAIAEGRNAIEDLRSEPAHRHLEHLLTAMGQQLESSQDVRHDPARFRLTVEGERRNLIPILEDEVYRITCELLRNAFQHAQARNIETEIRYDDRLLCLRIRDDGKGIDAEVLQEGRAGHWGLPGIRERAKHIGAKLDFWSGTAAGTEVELTVPAVLAYMKSQDSAGFRLFRKKAPTHAP